ncbi:hypothetical protein [Spirilliplanes yamanashiensis]|uniref:LemA family protein n=1 Tax=Spirilliplanes yamanashiensis TaxID=42233 RepID=A0A8J3YCD6_9ACTN|nr:hypothetical protein [Spirilliplanes yamanashiensis]MDP9818681.1 hypothetical protein [Spirilliplanes yamanashiensis]GIJ05138.1 hypothetical protein Sya03_44900 [Spirilliplanes yamanashiensis]
MWWVVGASALVALLSAYVVWTARRVVRLHVRAEAAARALDAHLLRRAAAAAVVAEAGNLVELYAAARIALDAGPDEREAAENDLTRQLRAVVPDLTLIATSRRVALAKQVHTDLVRDALNARNRRLVRLFRMARRHPRPAYFDIVEPTLAAAPAVPAPALPRERTPALDRS